MDVGRRAALSLVAGGVACFAAPSAPAATLLDRAIAARGGRKAVSRVKALRWTGSARVHAGDRTIEIGVDTRVVPFRSALSQSWLASDGPSKRRSLSIGPDEAYIERNGVRSPAPAGIAAHERQQFAFYGLMLFRPLIDGSWYRETDANSLEAEHDAAPATLFVFDERATLIRAANTVVDSDGGPPIAQDFSFDELIEHRGVRWPRRMMIRHRGAPYFELSLDTFSVEH